MLAVLALAIAFKPFPHEHCSWEGCCDRVHVVVSGSSTTANRWTAEGTTVGANTVYFMNPLGQPNEDAKIRIDGPERLECVGLRVCDGCGGHATTWCEDMNQTAVPTEVHCVPHPKPLDLTLPIAVGSAGVIVLGLFAKATL